VRWKRKFLNILDINLVFLIANIIHNIHAKNCAIIVHSNKQRVLNLLHVSAFLVTGSSEISVYIIKNLVFVCPVLLIDFPAENRITSFPNTSLEQSRCTS
jgi:hypothetical protein